MRFFSGREKKMKKLFVFLIAVTTLTLTPAQASKPVVDRHWRDIKLPTQQVLERQTITNPIDADTNYVLETHAGATSAAAATVTTFNNQPDVPRNLTITPTGTTGDVESCVVTVTGTNIFNQTISETFSFSADASTATTGNKAFKTVTSAAWAANCESGGFGATWIIGVGAKLGLKRCMASAGDVIHAKFNGATESLGASAGNASAVESNTYTPSGTMDGAKSVVVDFIQNFACFP
jgi:hypothetical protein